MKVALGIITRDNASSLDFLPESSWVDSEVDEKCISRVEILCFTFSVSVGFDAINLTGHSMDLSLLLASYHTLSILAICYVPYPLWIKRVRKDFAQ
jgi:hypothetical protein